MLVPDETQAYKICFCDYIIYQIRNESYCSYDPAEERLGCGLVLFHKSKFLDYLNQSTDAVDNGMDAYPTKLRHYGVYTLNHVIDVISHVEPTIEKVLL